MTHDTNKKIDMPMSNEALFHFWPWLKVTLTHWCSLFENSKNPQLSASPNFGKFNLDKDCY